MQVAVIGTGHVGLVTCVTLAHIGHEVAGFDSDNEKIESLRAGKVPFFEPRLQDLLEETTGNGRLSFSSDPRTVLVGAEAVFICVGTPPRASGEASLVAVERSAGLIASHITRKVAVIEKSTVPAGTSERLSDTLRLAGREPGRDFEIVSNPEFLREGSAVDDALHPDRILVGAGSEWAFVKMRELYRPLIDAGAPVIETDIATAELAKHACNAFLALKISYANALAQLCDKAGADVVKVADVMGADARIGRSFLNAGLGFGGFCFPKDLVAFEHLAEGLGYSFPLLREVARINDEAVAAVHIKIQDALWNLEDKRVALLGVSFKPGTDDVRFSPALRLAERLLENGATVVAYDPQAMREAKAELHRLEFATNAYDAVHDAHAVVVCTEWDEFRSLELARIRDLMAYPVFVDARNMFDPEGIAALGFTYHGVGRPTRKNTD